MRTIIFDTTCLNSQPQELRRIIKQLKDLKMWFSHNRTQRRLQVTVLNPTDQEKWFINELENLLP